MTIPAPIDFAFPLPRVHTGIHLANGKTGLLVWGTDRVHITVGRTGFWDRRGGREFASPLTYAELLAALRAGKEEEVRAAFRTDGHDPYQLGGGRVELDFGSAPVRGRLHPGSGDVEIELASGEVVIIELSMRDEVAVVRSATRPAIRVRPSWEWTAEPLSALGVSPPETWADEAGAGFVQTLPADDSLMIAVERTPDELRIGTALGQISVDELRARLRTAIDPVADASAYWSAYWNRLPAVPSPDPALDEIIAYSLWKLGGLTTPGAVPATLQGPWMEEHRIPLWSNDYHFNINLQMIYWPCLHLGLGDHLRPLWEMIVGWMPRLRASGERFFGVPGALMLPHAVDDRCHPIGSFWQGTIDHASTAWVAQMAWLDYAAHGDEWVLREVAWPLLVGAFEGYAAMLEDDGFPLSVSPEWGEGAIGSWGANASFGLAAFAMVVDLLPKAAAAMNAPVDPRWATLSADIPKASLIPVAAGPWDDPAAPPRFRIGLWEGQDLTESHRHHSHLAGIYPFESVSPDDPTTAEGFRHWASMGGGNWSSWGAMWAVCLMARAGWRTAARAYLRFAVEASVNEGKSLSAGGCRGAWISWGSAEEARLSGDDRDHEVMQLDANMGLITAAIEVARATERPTARR